MTIVGIDERVVDVAGVRLHVVARGDQAAPTVLLVHGLNTQLHTWDPVAVALSASYRTVSLDLRGHGDSSWTPSGYWVQDFVDDLVGLVGALHLGAVSYVGHSFGGRLGVAFAARHPELVDRLVISDSGPEMATVAARNVQSRQAPASGGRPLAFRTLDDVRAHYREQNPDWDDEAIELYARYQVRTNWAGKLVPKADPDLYWLMGSAGGKEIGALWADAARVKCPALLCWASRGVLNQDLVDRMAATIPGLRVEHFDTGHGIPREAPERFLAILQDFLAGGRPGQAAPEGGQS
jgi:pimeloyl-ACP methyl ester carboxylesterase